MADRRLEEFQSNGLEWQSALKLMARRMGDTSLPTYYSSTVEGAEDLAQRLTARGGFPQQERMIRDKRHSLDKATLYSYQAALIKKVVNNEDVMDGEWIGPVRALINPDKTKQDYDDKIVSVGYEYGFKPGDVFEWCRTHSYWLIYLQDLNELAYFRGEIRRCDYQITWLDEDGNEQSTYAAIRGPVETKINFIQKHGISVDEPNYSLHILMPRNPQTMKQFKRYSKFYLNEADEDDDKICWRVEATDSISAKGILEITAVEYYANETEDDIEKGLVGAFITKMVEPEVNVTVDIVGDTFIKPKLEYTYYVDTKENGTWHVTNPKVPVSLEPFTTECGIHGVKLKWNSSYSGQFILQFGDATRKEYYKHYSKTIVVESLF